MNPDTDDESPALSAAQDEYLKRCFNGVREAIQSGQLSCDDAAARFHELLYQKASPVCVPAVWQRITLGTGLRHAEDFQNALTANGFAVNSTAIAMLRRIAFTAARSPITVDAVNISVAELGCISGVRYSNLVSRANQLGLRLAPPELGPQGRFSVIL